MRNAMTPEVMAIAERQAATDRALLARLVDEGKVKRAKQGEDRYETKHPRETQAFVTSINRLRAPKTGINLAIRPKKKRHA